MVPRPASGIPHKNRALQVNTRNVQVVVVQKLPPHPHTRLAIFVILRSSVYTQWDVEVGQDVGDSFFEVVEALRLCRTLLQADLFLVRDNDDLVSASFSVDARESVFMCDRTLQMLVP